MAGTQGTIESAVPLSRLHGHESADVADFPAPTGREEEWRFTPLRRLRGLHSASPGGQPPGPPATAASPGGRPPGPPAMAAARGRRPAAPAVTGSPGPAGPGRRGAEEPGAAPGEVVVEIDAAPEVQVESVRPDDQRLGRAYVPTDRVSALAFSSFRQATVVTVPKESVASRPTVISVRGSAQAGQRPDEVTAQPHGSPGASAARQPPVPGPSFGHVLVDVEPFAEAVIVLDYRGSATYADNVEFAVGDGASLSVIAVQGWAGDTVHLSHHHAQIGRDARFKHAAVTLGGDVVRMAPSVRYAGPGGEAELLGIYFSDAGQHLEHRLFVDHTMPDCRSRVAYKGALQGDGAHAVWIGDVIIRADATGTDTYEYNRNLVLTDGTRVDSVPNLEILTGEVVGAGHASASGRLEDVHLFYLMARGIPYEAARRLVIRGFFGELIERIDVASLRTRIADTVDAELMRSAGGQVTRPAAAPDGTRPGETS